MFSEAQIQYLEEVLGTSVESFRRAPQAAVAAAPTPSPQAEVVVLTPALTTEEQALLDKILASVQLSGHVQLETLEPGAQAAFTLSFYGDRPGRHGTYYGFPTVASMTGANAAETTARKKETWNLLKLFQLARTEA